MAIDKLVDSAQLESDLTDVADAIRAKTGGTVDLQFPADYVSEIGSISGGGDPYDKALQILTHTLTVFESDISGVIACGRYLQNQTALEKLSLPNVTSFGTSTNNNCEFFASGCTNLSTLHLPKVQTFFGNQIFRYCHALQTVVLPSFYGLSFQYLFGNCNGLTAFDCGAPDITRSGGFNQNDFANDANLKIIILRHGTVRSLSNVNNFTSTPFASGGTGGTIYIPKVLYDELGTGSANDYKAATNWSTVDAYGTITWAQIEGSQYETAYADGTLIPTT